jgi:anaerobic magnesium-protoporphyrin IX monomethyl ester cyclase
VQLAIEAGDQEVQNSHVDKKVKISRVPEVIEMLKSRGIETRGLFMVGFPGETRAQIQRTIDLALSLDLDDFYISLVTPLPGTPLFDECVEKGLLTEQYNFGDVRYSLASIRLPDTTIEELQTLRRSVWREAFEERQRRLAESGGKKTHFIDRKSYETVGFRTLEAIKNANVAS